LSQKKSRFKFAKYLYGLGYILGDFWMLLLSQKSGHPGLDFGVKKESPVPRKVFVLSISVTKEQCLF
jgi:hypothetical protein